MSKQGSTAALSSLAEDANDSDMELLQRIVEKDRVAFETLYFRYHRRLTRFLLRVTRQEALVEEALNDTMFAVWQSAGRFRAQSRVSTWLFGIAYRTALKLLRKDSHSVEEDVRNVELVDPDEPAGQLSIVQTQRWLVRGLERLSPEHRAVVELTYYHGYSYPEVAKIVDCPVNTVKTRMFHARKRLKEILPTLGGAVADHRPMEVSE